MQAITKPPKPFLRSAGTRLMRRSASLNISWSASYPSSWADCAHCLLNARRRRIPKRNVSCFGKKPGETTRSASSRPRWTSCIWRVAIVFSIIPVTGVKLEYELPWPFNLEAPINYQWERTGLAERDAARCDLRAKLGVRQRLAHERERLLGW